MSTRVTLVHRVHLPSVGETCLQKFSEVHIGKQNSQSRSSLISAKLARAFSEKHTSCEMQQVPNPPSMEDEPFYAHHNQFLNDGYYMIELQS